MRHHRTTMATALASSALLALTVLAGPASAAHEGLVVTGLTQNDRLVTFEADKPGTILSTVKITGVAGDIIGIDFRPATGDLYAVGNVDGVGTIYTVDTVTGVATAVVGAATLTLSGEDFGFDFNPAADRLRIVSDLGQNLRINVATGATTVDGALTFAGAEGTPAAVGAAYTNNDNDRLNADGTPNGGQTGTTLFDIETLTDALYTQAPPNDGVLTGKVGLGEVGKDVGFDVYSELDAAGRATSNVALFTNRKGGETTISVVRLAPVTTPDGTVLPAGVVGTSTKVIATNPPVVDIAIDPAQ